MAYLTTTTFLGVQTTEIRPRDPVRLTPLQTVAKDHALIYELLTNKKADLSGGAPNTAGHNHSEAGNLLYWPLCSQQFGRTVDDPFSTFGQNYDDPVGTFDENATGEQGVALLYWPVFVPRGWAGKTFLVLLECSRAQDPRCFLTAETWGTASPPTSTVYRTATGVSGSMSIPFEPMEVHNDSAGLASAMAGDGGNTFHVASFTPAVVGLHTLKITTDIAGGLESREFYSVSVIPALSSAALNAGTSGQKPAVSASNLVTVGDPNSTLTYDYHPVEAALATADMPAGPLVVLNHLNGGILEEWAMGLPASGQATKTTGGNGHVHSQRGVVPWSGVGVEFCLGAWAFGTVSTNAALRARSLAPYVKSTAGVGIGNATDTHYLYLRTPVDEGTSALYGAVLVNIDPAKTSSLSIGIRVNSGTERIYTSSIPGAGAREYQLITLAGTHAAASGGWSEVRIRMWRNVDNTDATPYLIGACLFWDY